MIKWLRNQIERCLMDRAFRNLHDKIDDQARQIKSLMAARDKVVSHTQHQANEVKAVAQEKKVKQSELDRQLGINRILKVKRHLEGQRQKAVIDQLRDYCTKETFAAICEDVRKRPDSEFIGDFKVK